MDPVSWVTLTRHAAICGALALADARPGRAVCLQSHQARDRVGGGDAICTTYTHGVQKTGRRRKRWNLAYKQKSCRVWNNAGLGQSPKLPVQSITQSHLIAIPCYVKAYCQLVTNMIHSWNNTCMLWICKGLSLLHLLIGALVKSDKKCIKKKKLPSCAAVAISTMLVTLGVSLAKKGMVTACRTQRQMFRTNSGSFSNLVGETNKQSKTKRDSHHWTKCAKHKIGQLNVGSLL